MENLKNVDQKKLAAAVKTGKTVVEFSAPWCPECRFLLPAWPLIEKDLSEYKFISVDHDTSEELMKEMNIKGMPSFIVYEDGKEKGRLINGKKKTKNEVEEFVRSTEAND
ncbi:MAG: thioredoxin family protein [Lactobacillus sp.]|jgi:thiol-disulfide isomerase/thioredoxin|nr:thioredoxin family protein [Lactobacillus sp.]MCH3905904.1 thioredoxin family protein [Lactobacillus sp.]MCH3990520.1 thioredoxin family protein [Lactobacillus sp.]MCH4068765.1 thioredoxin family protein [Lactobacillus sp.]MCI1303750.1 thioredoxin family protein [Lactobacillus sp.]